MALGDWLGCYRVDNRVDILPYIWGQLPDLDQEAYGNSYSGIWLIPEDVFPLTLVQGSTPVTLV